MALLNSSFCTHAKGFARRLSETCVRTHRNVWHPCRKPKRNLRDVTKSKIYFVQIQLLFIKHTQLHVSADIHTSSSWSRKIKMFTRAWEVWGRFTHSMPRPCRSPAVPCRAVPLIHTRHAAPLPCSDSAVSFVKVRVVAGNIRTTSPTV